YADIFVRLIIVEENGRPVYRLTAAKKGQPQSQRAERPTGIIASSKIDLRVIQDRNQLAQALYLIIGRFKSEHTDGAEVPGLHAIFGPLVRELEGGAQFMFIQLIRQRNKTEEFYQLQISRTDRAMTAAEPDREIFDHAVGQLNQYGLTVDGPAY